MLASLLTHYLIHYGYPGRKATAGNIAYPLSPNLVSFQAPGRPVRRHRAERNARPGVLRELCRHQRRRDQADLGRIPGCAGQCQFHDHGCRCFKSCHSRADRRSGYGKAGRSASQEIERITRLATPKTTSRLNLDAPDAYAWSLYHLLQNEDVIKNGMFPITYYMADGAEWIEKGKDRPRYFDIGEIDYAGNLDDRTLSLIADHPPEEPFGSHRLLDMAVVIRSKDAGINRLTFDIIFTSGENYEAALRSNIFCEGKCRENPQSSRESRCRNVLRRYLQRHQDLDRPAEYFGFGGRARCVRSAATSRDRTAGASRSMRRRSPRLLPSEVTAQKAWPSPLDGNGRKPPKRSWHHD